ncbi:MAG TPA: phosphoribosylformylglycinamidine synthase I [Candidatus Omnitrophica bacterium]|nr:phosphoribosylformylglycinamidine synthase I [Candidatus Omnitrophota bacterium]
MAKPKVLILKTAGINCDRETAFAFESAGADIDLVHINELVSGGRALSAYQILAISGGFTYGDDIAAGKVLANELKCKLFGELKKFTGDGKLIIGICNGFQVLVKAGLLPGNDEFRQEATLVNNDCGVFQDKWIHLKCQVSGVKCQDKCVWTKGLPEVIYLPIAHGEGKFIPKSEEVLQRLKDNGQIVFQYCDARGQLGDYPVNPNGSVDSIAGICDASGRVFGLMPHPERHLISLQHPRWTREGCKRHGDGFPIFLNAVNYFK